MYVFCYVYSSLMFFLPVCFVTMQACHPGCCLLFKSSGSQVLSFIRYLTLHQVYKHDRSSSTSGFVISFVQTFARLTCGYNKVIVNRAPLSFGSPSVLYKTTLKMKNRSFIVINMLKGGKSFTLPAEGQ